MEFRIRFYETDAGEVPVRDFLDELRHKQPTLHKLVTAGLAKLRLGSYHGPPLTETVEAEAGILELRVGGRDIAPDLLFFRPGREIVCTNGYVKKSQKVDPQELDRARRYKANWENRHDA